MKTAPFRVNRLAVVALVSLAAVSPVLAGFSGTDLFLPSVGSRPGVPPSVWYTTVWLHNPGPAPANATFYLLERDKANTAPLHVEEVVAAGATRKYENAVELLFGKKVFGALRVTSSERVIVSSRVFSQAGAALEDSVGQFFAGIPAAFAIGEGERTEIIGGAQTQPASTSTFRFNFGFVETTGTGTCEAEVTVKDRAGVTLGSKVYTVRQWEQVQKALKDEFPSVSDENVRLTVAVLPGSAGRLLAFGSGVANGSQDATTLEMQFADELLVGGASGLVTGGVTFGGATGGLAQDAASLFWDDANDRLGLGTATPSEQLELTGNLKLPATTATVGQVRLGPEFLLHAFGTANVFMGAGSGNTTLTTAQHNVGIGRHTLFALTEGISNTAVGSRSLVAVTSGSANTGVGRAALRATTTGSNNTAIGAGAMDFNSVGERNLAAGQHALGSNVDGSENTAVGANALNDNVSGSHNTAVGKDALYSATAGVNTAVGWTALRSTTTGIDNAGVGSATLWTNTVGSRNTAVGEGGVLFHNTADNNTALGWASLHMNTTGAGNVGLGINTLWSNTEGSGNVAIGDGSLGTSTTGGGNTAVGNGALREVTTGSGNIALGEAAGAGLTTGGANIFVGSAAGAADESGTIRIGTKTTHARAFIQGISGVSVAGADPVYVQPDGQLGTVVPSSRRFKEAIKPIGDAGSLIQNLRPVSFRYLPELDRSGATQYGLIAEEVAEVAPELVVHAPSGEPDGVRYHLLGVLLVSELQRQQGVIEQQSAEIDKLRRQLAALAAAVASRNRNEAGR